MNWRLRIPGALYRQAIDRAGSDAALAERVRSWLHAYVAGQSPGSLFAASGDHAVRALYLSDEAAGPACSNVPVPATTVIDDQFREP